MTKRSSISWSLSWPILIHRTFGIESGRQCSQKETTCERKPRSPRQFNLTQRTRLLQTASRNAPSRLLSKFERNQQRDVGIGSVGANLQTASNHSIKRFFLLFAYGASDRFANAKIRDR